ncbi:MAG: DUF5830 family protein [Methanosarcinaceae archaeon]|nr:DUF5830 family protein [Methanosarcinaceae archaeon]
MNSKIEAGLELISALGVTELTPLEMRDLLHNLITKDYNKIDEILAVAQEEKMLQRTDKAYVLTPESSLLEFDKPRIIKQDEKGVCGMCGKGLSKGYYVEFKTRIYGPYGSSCVQKVYLDYLL